MNRLHANGIELGYDCFGETHGNALLLISGLGTQRLRWTVPFCEALAARGYRVIRFDNRDAGASTHLRHAAAPDLGTLAAMLASGQQPALPYTLRDMADDAIALLDALGIERAHIVGRSMGGMIAQIAASEHRSRVRSLASIMSSSGNPALPPAAPDVMAMMMRPAPDPVADEAAFIEHSLAFARRIAGRGFPFDAQQHRALLREERRHPHDAGSFARQLAALANAGDRRARLATIAAPTLVIHGADDPLVPPACGEDTATAIPGANFMLIDGMGHDLPTALDDTIADAIDRNARRAGG
ncbi:alpha/beta fold hydrolase [Paraburkholderia sp. J67]|uniref:alpha/beta fold hydrolase n=1 Tax=Paraburkholderia sp. J67 TaxID=2805435 RepID=UPI002ABE5336|nr:alpha/beta fold hydrolase [Paraburkholderia sp. J67]